MAIENLPHWTIAPNWRTPVTERLEALTAVMVSPSGAEQRFAARWSPRRTFEPTITATSKNRSLFDLSLGAVGGAPWYVPVWHDGQTLAAAFLAGATALPVDTEHREFRAGRYVMLQTDDYTSEVLEVTSVAPGAVTLAAGPAANWPAGTRVYPAVKARVGQMPDMNRIGSRILENVMQFEVVEDTDYEDPDVTLPYPTYAGLMVLTTRPDEGENITHSRQRLLEEIDGETGLRRRYDTAAMDFTLQRHQWLAVNRQQRAELRSLFYALDGRRGVLWLPTFADDFVLVDPADSGDNSIVVERCGFTAYGGPRVTRQDVWIALRNGTNIFRGITGSSNGMDSTEVIVLDGALGLDIAPADVLRISFMAPCRLDADMMEFTHHSDGVSRTALNFRSAPDFRVGSEWSPNMPPDMMMNDQPCGVETCTPLIYDTGDGPRKIADAVSGEQRTHVSIARNFEGNSETYVAFVKTEDGKAYYSHSPDYLYEKVIADQPAVLGSVTYGRLPGAIMRFYDPSPFEEVGGAFGLQTSVQFHYDTPAVSVDRGDIYGAVSASDYPIIDLWPAGPTNTLYMTTFDGEEVRFGVYYVEAPLGGLTAISGDIDEVHAEPSGRFASETIVTHSPTTNRLTVTWANFYDGAVEGSALVSEGTAAREKFLASGWADAVQTGGKNVVVWREWSAGSGPGGSVKMRRFINDEPDEVISVYSLTGLAVAGYTHLANREPIAVLVLPNASLAIIERRYETVGAQLRSYEVLIVHAPLESSKQSAPMRLTPPGVGPTGDVKRSADLALLGVAGEYAAWVGVAWENPVDNTTATEVQYITRYCTTCTYMFEPE